MARLFVLMAVAISLSVSGSAAPKPETLRGHLMPYKCRLDPKQTHTRDCALLPECMATGYGLALENGSFLQFDLESSKRAVRVLQQSRKSADLMAVAEGTRVGPLFRLRSLRLE